MTLSSNTGSVTRRPKTLLAVELALSSNDGSRWRAVDVTLLVLCGLPGGHFRRPDALVPDLVLDTTGLGPQAAAQRIVQLLPG